MVSEAVAVLVIAPFLLYVAGELGDGTRLLSLRYALYAIAMATLVVDGWLLYRWYSGVQIASDGAEESACTASDADRIRRLVRQAARWSVAAKQDSNVMIAVLHANYGASYLWSLLDLYSTSQIKAAVPELDLDQFKGKITEVQDWATKQMSSKCPSYAPEANYLAKVAGDIS